MSAKRVVAFAATVFALAVATTPAHAQRYHADFGINGGGSWYSNSLSADELGGTTAGPVRFKPSWLAGTQLTFWGLPFHVGPRFGLRLNGTYTDNKFIQKMENTGDTELFTHMNMWSGSADLMFGFKSPNETWSGMEILPYLALGGGIKWTNPSMDNFTINDLSESKSWNGFPFTCLNGVCSIANIPPGGFSATNPSTPASVANQRAFFYGEANSPMGLIGLGTDIRVAPTFALRLEVGDRLWKAPIVRANAPIAGQYRAVVTTNDDKIVGKIVNEVYGQVGLHMLFGLQRVAPVAIVAPAPPPPPAPAPMPAPAPREERSINVCVIDPSGPMGIRTVEGTFIPSTNETFVMQNGNRVLLSNAYTTVPVASGSDWFVQGQPLTLTIGPTGKAQYTTYGSSRVIDAGDLGYLGTVHGLAIYADKDDVKDVQHQLDELRSAQANADFNDILNQQKDLRSRLDNMKVVYVPLQPTGCVFQAMQRVEEVRKAR